MSVPRSRYSVSYWHNQLWSGAPAYRFSSKINASDVFESQAYTGLVQVGPADFLVLYNKYWPELYDGMPGCNPSGDQLGQHLSCVLQGLLNQQMCNLPFCVSLGNPGNKAKPDRLQHGLCDAGEHRRVIEVAMQQNTLYIVTKCS